MPEILLSCQNLSKSYGSRVLFENLNLSLFSGERVGLIGPNGAGKSTFIKIIVGEESADSGTLSFRTGTTFGFVPQAQEFEPLSPFEILLKTFEKPDYEAEATVREWLGKGGFTGKEKDASTLSGGWKKRLSIILACVHTPDFLLLDEPTNHLDLEAIEWLEKFLKKEVRTYLLISHDRLFLQAMTSRIIEIDRAYPTGLFSVDGPYLFFLEKKNAFLEGQKQQERSLSSKARKEMEWLSRSPKARTTKSTARVEQALELKEELSQIKMRNLKKEAAIDFVSSERETRKLIIAKNLGVNLSDRPLFSHLDVALTKGVRLGLLGKNGSGKTTLLKLLAGELEPDTGTIKRADDLKIVYFDQHRTLLNPNATLKEALCPHGDYVEFHGEHIHIVGWCKRFLFSPDLLSMPISRLSLGERARISIAHLMLQPADVLLLDEPTNDLDIPTLERLEESLLEFPGAVVLITHDRFMLERLCTTFLHLGQKEETPSKKEPPPLSVKPKTKLSYHEKREYDAITGKIEQLEREIQHKHHLLQEAADNQPLLTAICQEVALLEGELEGLYLRWDTLHQKTVS